mgnify:CR=1 FL=1
MKINKQDISAEGIKITIWVENEIIARAFLYLLRNDMHEKPFGFLEDVFVEEQFRGKGYGEKITKAVIEEARKQGCYKLICTSRFSNEKAHKLYDKLGFKNHGNEFRIDF